MEPERYHRVTTIFQEVVNLSGQERTRRLDQLCNGDNSLRREVLQLLSEDEEPHSLLSHDVAILAGFLMGDTDGHTAAGRQVGPYRIIRFLGEGGMGVVYLAERDDMGQTVAVKFLRDAWLSLSRRQRFFQEQRTLAKLNHPSIARIYDADTLPDGTPWFAMEYVEGQPITQYCRANGLSIPARLEVFSAVCAAVQHAHSRAILHRDLKPGNILAKADASVRLLDFGIARTLNESEEVAESTRTGLRMLTPAWAAPELLRGEPAGIQTDVYSLGVILYELLTDRLPARNSETADLANGMQPPSAVVNQDSSTLLQVSKSEWADLDVLCLTAMHPDPQRRYPSVEALLRDIRHFQNGQPLDARPDSTRYRLRKFAQRNRRAIVATAAAVAIFALTVAAFTWRITMAREAATAEAQRAQRVQAFLAGLFDGNDEYAGPSQNLKVAELLAQGVRDAETLHGDPALKADLLENLSGVYQRLGDLDQADRLLHASLQIRQQSYGEEHPDVARSKVSLGLLRMDQAAIEESERLVREGLRLAKASLPEDHPEIARSTSALGSVLIEKGDYPEAISVLEEAVRLAGQQPDTPVRNADPTLMLANAHFYAGNYELARQLNERLLESRKAKLGPKHPAVADVTVNLGAIAFEIGEYAEAEARYRTALESKEAWFGPNHPGTASVLTMLGRALVRQEKLDDAASILERALTIQRTVHGEKHPSIASALNELGALSLRRKRYAEAEAQFQQVAAIYREIHTGRHYLHGIALSNLASAALFQERLSLAESRLREAIREFQATLEPRHLNIGIGQLKLGRVLLRQKRYAEARKEILDGSDIVRERAGAESDWLKMAAGDVAQLPPAYAVNIESK
jgi:serine/threonine protein kinase/Tfp pilus assembly protein PilF